MSRRRRRRAAGSWFLVPAFAVLLGGAGYGALRLVNAKPASQARGIPSPHPSASPTVRPTALNEPLSLYTIFRDVVGHGQSFADYYNSKLGGGGIDYSQVATITVTGDVIPGRNTNAEMVKRNDFLWPFREVVNPLQASDAVFINLESPLLPGCPVTVTGFQFCGDTRFIDGLTYAHVSVANLSNNHLTNYGATGSDSTIKLLTDHGIQPCGLGLIAYMTIKGTRFAFLGMNGVGTPINRAELKREVGLARANADVVIVQFHWGMEYKLVPQSTHDSIAPDDPREIGHLAIDDGADLVIGNHPHAVQGVETYKGKLITYAHGNFVFDQMWTPDPPGVNPLYPEGQEDPRNGVIGQYRFYNGRLIAVDYTPIRIYDYGQPRFEEVRHGWTPTGEQILERMWLSSLKIAGLA